MSKLAWLFGPRDRIVLQLADARTVLASVRATTTQRPDAPGDDSDAGGTPVVRDVLLSPETSVTLTGTHTEATVRAPVTIAADDGRQTVESVAQPVFRYQTPEDSTTEVAVDTITIFSSGYPQRRQPAKASLIGTFQESDSESFVTVVLLSSGSVVEVPGKDRSPSSTDLEEAKSYPLVEFRGRYENGLLAPCDDATLFFAEFV